MGMTKIYILSNETVKKCKEVIAMKDRIALNLGEGDSGDGE